MKKQLEIQYIDTFDKKPYWLLKNILVSLHSYIVLTVKSNGLLREEG